MPLPPLRRTLPWLVLLAVVLRLGLLGWNLHAHPQRLAAAAPPPAAEPGGPRLSPFGFEASNVADALVCRGRGFADPFGVATGPTAWVSPGVVALYAVPFALFGCYTPAAVLAVFAVALALSAASVLLMARAAERLFPGRDATATALLAALLFAVSPFDLGRFTAASALDLNLHAFLLLLLLHQLLGLGAEPTARRAAGFALTTAAATLCNPVFALVGAAGLVVATWGCRRRLATALLLLLAAQAAVVAPYAAYQRPRLGGWVFVKSNLPFELSLGNRSPVAGVADATTFRRFHPSQSADELRRYRRLGEKAYLAHHAERLRRDLAAADLARWTARRAGRYFFAPTSPTSEAIAGSPWTALTRTPYLLLGAAFLLYPAVRRPGAPRGGLRRAELLPYALALTYAAPHLLALVQPRYVWPLAPLALLLAAGAVGALWRARGGRRGERGRAQ